MTDSSAGCSSLSRAATCCRAGSTSPPTSPTHPGPGTAGWTSTPSEGGYGFTETDFDMVSFLGLVMLNTCEV